jgi:hypothetical protein
VRVLPQGQDTVVADASTPATIASSDLPSDTAGSKVSRVGAIAERSPGSVASAKEQSAHATAWPERLVAEQVDAASEPTVADQSPGGVASVEMQPADASARLERLGSEPIDATSELAVAELLWRWRDPAMVITLARDEIGETALAWMDETRETLREMLFDAATGAFGDLEEESDEEEAMPWLESAEDSPAQDADEQSDGATTDVFSLWDDQAWGSSTDVDKRLDEAVRSRIVWDD